jgi:protein YibB
MAVLQNEMVVFTTADLVDRVKDLRTVNAPNSRTTVVAVPSIEQFYPQLVDRLSSAMEAVHEYCPNFLTGPHNPEYWNPSYVMVNMAKTEFACRAYDHAAIDPDRLVAWVDFGYCTRESVLGSSTSWDFGFSPDKLHFFSLHEPDPRRPIFDIVRTGSVYITGCQIVGNMTSWKYLRERNDANLGVLLKCGLVDDDQTLLLMSYFDSPERVELHHITPGAGWHVVFRDFNEAWRPLASRLTP